MRWCLHVSLIVFAFALAGCVFVTPPELSRTPRAPEAPRSSETPPTAATPECVIKVPQADGSMKCVPTTTPMVLSTRVCVIEECPCVSPIFVEAWIDQNGNGIRDREDEPLQGVRFRLQWLEDFDTCSTPYTASQYLITDATGHDFYSLYGCACGTEELEVETPVGYKLVAHRGECLFDAPASYGKHSMSGQSCLRYGFTPIAP